VRQWTRSAYQIGLGMWQSRSESRTAGAEMVNAVLEQPIVPGTAVPNPDIDGRRETVQCI